MICLPKCPVFGVLDRVCVECFVGSTKHTVTEPDSRGFFDDRYDLGIYVQSMRARVYAHVCCTLMFVNHMKAIFSRGHIAAISLNFLQSITPSILVSRSARPSVSPHKMSCTGPAGSRRETRKPRGGLLVSCYGVAANPKTYQPSGERAERNIEGPGRSEMTTQTHHPRYYMHGEQRSALPPQRTSPSDWEEERQLLRRRNPSPDWHDDRRLTESDTLPARRENEVQPARKDMRDIKQPTSKGARVHFQRPVERRPMTPEDDDDEGVSGSSTDDSLEGSLTIVEKDESRLGDRKCTLSHSFDVIEHEEAGTGDEDGYVYVPRRMPLGRST